MSSLISIPFYLWKNTFNRWLESPTSPLTKILVPFLLSTLALLVMLLFSGVEAELRNKLNRVGLRTVIVQESHLPGDAFNRIQMSQVEHENWKEQYKDVQTVRQLLIGGKWASLTHVPVISYNEDIPEFSKFIIADGEPQVLLLQKRKHTEVEQKVEFADLTVFAKPVDMPERLGKTLNRDVVIAAPETMLAPFFQSGFASTTLITLPSTDEVKIVTNTVRAYYRAEGRRVRIQSAYELLEDLKQLTETQKRVRAVIIIAVATILALILGTIALMESRQEAYLHSLLRSFGVSRLSLAIHTLLENILLVAAGLALAAYALKRALPYAANKIPMLKGQDLSLLIKSEGDTRAMLIAISAGVILALLPSLFGLRKSIGRVLQ